MAGRRAGGGAPKGKAAKKKATRTRAKPRTPDLANPARSSDAVMAEAAPSVREQLEAGVPATKRARTRGHPFTAESRVAVQAFVLHWVARGFPISALARWASRINPDFPSENRIREWADDEPAFAETLTRAREHGAWALMDQALEIADDAQNDWMEIETRRGKAWVVNNAHINRDRARIDLRKFIASKMLPQRFGDSVDVTSGGKPIRPQVFQFGKTVIEF